MRHSAAPRAMMQRIFLEILRQIRPPTTNTHHHPLSTSTNKTHKELNRGLSLATVQMVKLRFRVVELTRIGPLFGSPGIRGA